MSVSKYDVQINQAYNFTLLAPQILGTGYSNATLKAVLPYSLANTVMSVAALHAAALPSLPAGTPSDPSQLVYYMLVTSTGAEVVVAEDWLASAPVLLTTTTLTVRISNVSPSDQARISAILNANNYTSFAFE